MDEKKLQESARARAEKLTPTNRSSNNEYRFSFEGYTVETVWADRRRTVDPVYLSNFVREELAIQWRESFVRALTKALADFYVDEAHNQAAYPLPTPLTAPQLAQIDRVIERYQEVVLMMKKDLWGSGTVMEDRLQQLEEILSKHAVMMRDHIRVLESLIADMGSDGISDMCASAYKQGWDDALKMEGK